MTHKTDQGEMSLTFSTSQLTILCLSESRKFSMVLYIIKDPFIQNVPGGWLTETAWRDEPSTFIKGGRSAAPPEDSAFKVQNHMTTI